MTTPQDTIEKRLDRMESLLNDIAKALHINEPPRRSHAELERLALQTVIDFKTKKVHKKRYGNQKKTQRQMGN